jgi:hypothetical protein
MLREQKPSIGALVKGSKVVEVLESMSDVPEGCSSETVGADVVVNLLIKGFINVDVELAKAEKKVAAAQAGIDRHQKAISKPETPDSIKASLTEDVSMNITCLLPILMMSSTDRKPSSRVGCHATEHRADQQDEVDTNLDTLVTSQLASVVIRICVCLPRLGYSDNRPCS